MLKIDPASPSASAPAPTLKPKQTRQSDAASIQALILAAGRGRRFDPTGEAFKLNQYLSDGRTVFEHTVLTVASVFPDFQIVLAPDTPLDASFVHKYASRLLICPDAASGMGHSLAYGVTQLEAHHSAVFVVLADMPWIQVATLQGLREQMLACLANQAASIVVPTYQTRRGHPVGFAAAMFPLLRALQGDQGARSLLASFAVCEVPVEDIGVLRDIDTAADLASAP
ncbi:nucleotidyltransferase family protein [Undibacterium cyanobacteriorum]|uniref:Nucleotidyltransferase family protein n=1 Tax=Undibacterium cyanobacteriorum TaxID=3073561 RepID=A0ABY9RGW6_9BURK|nr:nucleotidyltransferase family protein [Undibacterium sp. 20NA77.5]WMW80104.1 nucleotidyltransferase family protein [Undibacterium sp. 20NA77.5]